MKKRVCLLMTLLLCVSALGSGCGKKTENAEKNEFSVWSTYNTKKVLQQAEQNETYEKLPAEISVQMMQDEKEGAQLIITADRDMTYTLKAGEMKSDDGNVIPMENISIYQQQYLTIESNTNGHPEFEAGDYIPDMLLPMEKAVEYGENTIKKGNNQGITVEFDSEGVEPGIYKGTFLLEIDGEETEIPATTEVWDIAYTGRRTFQSSFLVYRSQLLVGEYDNSESVIQSYVDFLMNYKINTYVIRDDNNVEAFLAECKRQFADDNCNSLIIPYNFPTSYKTYDDSQKVTNNAETVLAYITELAKISTEETPYIEYAYFYPTAFDEADWIGTGGSAKVFLKKGGELEKTLEEAINRLKSEGWFAKQTPEFAKRMETAIRNIPAIFTNVKFMEEWVNSEEWHTVFCPYMSVFDDTSVLQQYQQAAEERGNGKLWGYTCSGPVYPYATFHIDDTTLGMRVCGWMEKAYDITGYLYYLVNKNTRTTETADNTYLNLYEEAARYYNINGDGFLVYPGKYYESDSPFGSLRLTSYRDSQDDYDMLCVYENLLNEYAASKQLADFDTNRYIADLYDMLFSGMVAKDDDALLYQARKMLADRILTLKERGEPVDPEAGREKVELTDFAKGTQNVKLNDASTISNNRNATANVVIRAEQKDSGKEIGSKTKLFRPYISVAVEDFANADTLYFNWENIDNISVIAQITLVTKSGEKEIVDTSYCAGQKTQKVRVHFADDMDIDKADVTEIRITFDNVETDENGSTTLCPDRNIVFSDFQLVMKD